MKNLKKAKVDLGPLKDNYVKLTGNFRVFALVFEGGNKIAFLNVKHIKKHEFPKVMYSFIIRR